MNQGFKKNVDNEVDNFLTFLFYWLWSRGKEPDTQWIMTYFPEGLFNRLPCFNRILSLGRAEISARETGMKLSPG